MRQSFNIQPHQYPAVLCYSIWKEFPFTSVPPCLELHNKQEISLGIPCLPAQHFSHESSSKNTVTVKTDLMKAISWKTAEANK